MEKWFSRNSTFVPKAVLLKSGVQYTYNLKYTLNH